MKKFQYQIVRYMHDRVTSEFVNIGIILYQPETQFLSAKFVNKFSRISQFFLDVNGQYILSTMRHFESEINRIPKQLDELFTSFTSLEEITNSILPKDDSALICSELLYGLDIKAESALNDLFERLVSKYNQEIDKDSHDDKYVWRKVYKQYFDKYEITNKLKPYTVKTTNHDHIEFDKAWKNGAWNCYQTLSFDLKRTDTIKGKVYKWSGIISELEKSNEKLNLYFLTVGSKRHMTIHKFIEDTLGNRNGKHLNVTLIKENQADKFVASVKKDIDEHTSV